MESFLSLAGFAGSAFSTVATAYFWFVRMRRERPCLKPHLVDKEVFLGASREQVRQIGLKIGVIVANYSVLPNAILSARLWLQSKERWQEVDHLAFDKQTPQPFNIPPLQTVLLRLTGFLAFPYQDQFEEGGKTIANYLNHFASQPLKLKLELRRLHDRADTHVLDWPADAQPLTLARHTSAA